MIGAFLAAAFQNNAFQVGDQYGVWGATGAVEKRKSKIKRNERPEIEQAIHDAINKVSGIDDASHQAYPATKQKRKASKEPIYRFDEIALARQAAALDRSISEYKAELIRAELDDEEAFLLLL